MKGLAMLGPGKMGWIEKERPVPGPLEALVKPLIVAPCTSDVHMIWEDSMEEYPGDRSQMILGHEAVAEVVEVGEMIKDFKPGDKVVVGCITPDWMSLEAQAGWHTHSGGMLGGWLYSNNYDGVFAEFFKVPQADANMALIPDSVDLVAAAMLPDMVATGFHAAELAQIEFGDTVAVFGIGPVGLMGVAAASLRGAARIIVVGSRKITFEVAKEYGATHFIDYKVEDPVEKILELTNQKGVDRVLVCGGGNGVIPQAFEVVKPGGMIGNTNWYDKGDLTIPRVAWGSGCGHKNLIGGQCPGGRYKMEKFLALLENKKLDPSKIVTHKYEGMENIEKCMVMMKEKPESFIKPVVIMNL